MKCRIFSPHKRISRATLSGIAGLCLLAMTGCNRGHDHDHDHGHGHGHDEHGHEEHEGEHADHTEISPEMATKSGIRVETAEPGAIKNEFELPGEVGLNKERMASVPARFGGVVIGVAKRVGDTTKQGELLAVIESLTLADARAEYIEAVHRLELAQARFVREEKLWRQRIGVEQDYLNARHDLEESEIRKQTARQKLRALGIPESELKQLAVEPVGDVVTFQVREPFPDQSLSRFELRAPIAGQIIERRVANGQSVRADDVLFEIADLADVWVNLAVYPGRLAAVTVGSMVRVSLGDMSAQGRIDYVSPVVSEPSRAAAARVVLPNEDGVWRPGMYVTARVNAGEEAVPVTVKPAALQTFEGRATVFVNEGNRYEAVAVKVGRRDSERVEILEGLKAGQRYVAAGSYVVKADILKSSAAHDHDH